MSLEVSFEAEINAYFVKTKTNEADNEDFQSAASVLRSHIPENAIRHIKASEGYPLIASGQLTKKDVFIFDHFEGDFFKQLQQTKSLIIGARCLLVCLIHNQPIPYGRSPVFTTAMRDLKISASGITPQEKEKLSIKIQWMGGYYLQNFGRTVTHLISNTIKSSKYEHASLNGIPVMHVDWVQRVWERSLVDYISATDEEFDKYRLPIFFDINVTSTGLDTAKKEEIIRLVQENGGTYHRAFRPQLVDIVITEKGKTDSEKYKLALRLKKDILTIEWIFDSIARGFALPTKDYQVKSLKVSTPTKPDQSIADFTSNDYTQLSEISGIPAPTRPSAINDVTVNDSVCSNLCDAKQTVRKSTKSTTFQAPPPPQPTASNARTSNTLQRDLLLKNQENNTLNYRSILEEISPREAKKAGNFLDGCCVYLSGFRTAEKEKLNRILNVGGATRYDAINDEITHVIVGEINDADFKDWKKSGLRSSAHIVRLDWLLESIKLKQTASENIYRVSLPGSREPDAPSPSSKKTLRSMNHSFKQPDLPKTKKKLFTAEYDRTEINNDAHMSQLSGIPRACSTELPIEDEDDEHALLAQYSQESLANAAPTALPEKETAPVHKEKPLTSGSDGVTAGAAAATVAGNQTEMTACSFDYEHLDVFKNLVLYVDREQFSEELYTQMNRECEAAHANLVTENFQDSVDYAIVTFEKTFSPTKLPVKAKNIVTELYVEICMKENKLLPIEYYHRPIPSTANSRPLKGMTIVISTYANFEREFIDTLAQLLGAQVRDVYSKKEQPLLICPEAKGAKYMGALKWRFPVVTSAWLLQCAIDGVKLPLGPYLVGESNADFPSPNSTARSYLEDEEKAKPSTAKKASKAEVTPLRHKRVAALASVGTPAAVTPNSSSGNLNAGDVDSPHTPANNAYGSATYKFEYMEKILDDIEDATDREFVRGIIEDIRANPTPELERIKRQLCTPANRRLSAGTSTATPNAVLDFCSTPEFKRRMAEEFDKRWHLPTKRLKPSTPLEQIRKRVILATCRDLGIEVNSDDDGESVREQAGKLSPTAAKKSDCNNMMTPLQHHRSSSLSSKKEPRTIFTLASPAPSSADKQRRSAAGRDNLYVPNTQEAVAIPVNGGLGTRTSDVGKSTIDFDKISFDDTTTTPAVNSLRKSTATPTITTSLADSPELKRITDYLKSKRQSSHRKNSIEERLDQLHKEQDDIPMETETEAINVQPFETEQFGYAENGDQLVVGWIDPIDFHKAKQAAKKRTMQYVGTPRFSISCADENRESIIEKIQKLGGDISTNLTNFDPDCTHFVCERPNRAEKSLGCIAAGKWVLSLKYIEECFAKDNFIDEELYEWGNPKAINLPNISTDEQLIAQASYRWRRELAAASAAKGDSDATDFGIFSGFRAILRINPKNQQALTNVIRAGKGVVIQADSPYSHCPAVRSATHCFIDTKKFPLNKQDYDFLQKCDVKIASFLYIQAYIVNGLKADFSTYEVKM